MQNIYQRKAISLFITLSLLSGIAFGQTNYDTIFKLKGFQRDIYLAELLASIAKQPNEISKLNTLIQSKGTAADKWQMNMMNELGFAPFPDSISQAVLNIYEKHLALAEKMDNHYFQARIYFIIGEYYNRLGFQNESFQNRLYCLDELEKDPTGNYFEQSWWLHQIALAYYEFGDYKKSLKLSKVGFFLNGVRSPNPVWFMKTSSNLVGTSFLRENMFDSAKIWFEKTYSLALQIKDTAWLGIATGNIGSVYYQQEKYAEAIPYYEKAVDFCQKASVWDNVAPFCCNLAMCYMQTGNLKSVGRLLDEAKKAIDLDYKLTNNIKYYSTLAKYYRTTRNAELALQSLDSLTKYKTKAEEEYSTSKKSQWEAQMAYNKKELEDEINEQEIKRGKWIRYGFMITSALLAIIGILYFKRQNLRHKLRQEHLENEKLNAELELSLAISAIKDFTQSIKDKNELIVGFASEIETLKKKNQSITGEQLVQIEELKQSVVLTDDDWSKFRAVFEKAYPGYLSRLKQKYPDLNSAEISYIIFTRLQTGAKDMSAMLGISSEDIEHIAMAVRKKTNISKLESFDDFVKGV